MSIECLEMIAAVVDARDPFTKGHSERVSAISEILAWELGLGEAEVQKVRVAALLHDIGKVGIDDRILKKPCGLTDEEFKIMKRHTVIGYEIVRQHRIFNEMLPGIRWHHEALDGKGYPDGLTGNEIPLMARIISAADSFDRMTADLPYQTCIKVPEALEYLFKLAGRKHDPRVVDALHSVCARGMLRNFGPRRTALAWTMSEADAWAR